jgi:hypothetical protein
MNTSVNFIPCNNQPYEDEGVFFTIEWNHGIPLYYFDYNPSTFFFVSIDTERKIEDVYIKSYKIQINEIDLDYKNDNIDKNINIKEDSEYSKSKYHGKTFVSITDSFLSETIKDENDLSKFKKIEYIILTVVVEYELEGRKKPQMSWNIFIQR